MSLMLMSCVEAPRTPSTAVGHYNLEAPYLWSTRSLPRTINISNQFTQAEANSIVQMGDAWKTAVQDKVTFFAWGQPVNEVSANLTNLDAFLDSTLGIYKITKWPRELPNTALAVTQLYGRRYNAGTDSEFVNIEHADILVNMDGYFFYTGDSGPAGHFDLRTVMLHEFGHFLGLPHNTSAFRSQTVMYPSITSAEKKRIPQNPDISALAERYNIIFGTSRSSSAMVGTQSAEYEVPDNQDGEELKIIIELHSDGSCVHRENGAVIQRH
jgi:hypothetical protein